MPKNNPKYHLNKKGEFVIENYNSAKPFSSFFPGIAGESGIPMWVFYVNRGQCVISFGTEDKHHAIAEFFPANRAWQLASLQGFRTFLKIKDKGKVIYYEPFQDSVDNLSFDIQRDMRIKSYELIITEINHTIGIRLEITYFTMPNEPTAALIREVKITNIKDKPLCLELLDGLPQVIPYGTSNFFLKKMSRTIEAWMRVDFLGGITPFYNLSVDPSDRPETSFIEGGNFYLPFHKENSKVKLLKGLVDPAAIFGAGDFSYPRNFISKDKFKPALSPEIKESKMPCAFSYLDLSIAPNSGKTIYSITGYAEDKYTLSRQIEKILGNGFVENKRKENSEIILGIEDTVLTKSGMPRFDFYARQTFLDNVLRGGYPMPFDTAGGRDVFYLYSRKHGDLERDYNNFVLAPTYFSQGNGNYRDMNQNRRCDNWLSMDVKESNLVNFLNLIQADGFNPLVVKGLSFMLRKDKKEELFSCLLKSDGRQKLEAFFDKPFNPGSLMMYIEKNAVKLAIDRHDFLRKAVSFSGKLEEAEHSEGFWTDHWTYNLDLLENYLGVYPEKLKEIFIDKKIFTFFDNAEVVRPRSEKYVLTAEGKIRQYHSLVFDKEKSALIKSRADNQHRVRADFGKGDVIYANLLNKFLCLMVNKLASLDAAGTGIEMEANKPNWFDSLNGLPALFGSSTNETFELKRLILFIEEALKASAAFRQKDIMLLSEIHDFLLGLGRLLEEYFSSENKDRDFIFWDKASSLKEGYREITKFGFSGKEKGINLTDLFSILDAAKRKVALGIARAFDKKIKLYHAYFINEVVDYELAGSVVRVKKFRQVPLPLFLEAQVHALRLERDRNKAVNLYKAVRRSLLYDKKLKMYKVCAPLKEAPVEIGRCRIFSPGWLENESIWLHMEYKFLLELLKGGLYKEFYDDFFNCLIPFLDARKYGRSILENSSFLVSSAFVDDKLHGNGFVARLSGSTAEFINIWRIMNTGLAPFKRDAKGGIVLEFKPVLHKRLFSRQKTYGFKFLNKTIVTYHANKFSDTFGHGGLSAGMYIFKDENGELVTIKSNVIPQPYAEKIRAGKIKKIDVYLV
ncbi:MAG: cellobiose phosphorylase [Candidatus Omnitrophica bacterium CG11_big_fil_rev_8_21_14_0_20_42_13]|uniref:Cellobiose phosphorylase n=1 Tax=Candidatus Ghiorseimicrobium undicola TaxID=1974746 RepID=A0A2H0LXQ0_9BACT|nr:MAG: cellobiose phosphorylase [Candidatus Omnitrophica bacterium CG11_big_fil_rev_8_21_14_0_20_42_13]